MYIKGESGFRERPEASIELVADLAGARDFVVFEDKLYCLTERNILVVPSEDEEYELLDEMHGMVLYSHYLYFITALAKVLVFDIRTREIVTMSQGMGVAVRRVRPAGRGVLVLCSDNRVYKILFEDLRFVRQDVPPHITESRESVLISDVVAVEDKMLLVDALGAIHGQGGIILKVFDAVESVACFNGLLYILTSKHALIRYDLNGAEGRRMQLMAPCIGQGPFVVSDGSLLLLEDETQMRVPRDTKRVVRDKACIYVQTLSGIYRILSPLGP
jgi:hypothetical protein